LEVEEEKEKEEANDGVLVERNPFSRGGGCCSLYLSGKN